LVNSSTEPDSDKGDNIILLKTGLLLSTFIITTDDSQIIFSSESKTYALKVFSQFFRFSISFSNIQSEFEVVVRFFVLLTSILT